MVAGRIRALGRRDSDSRSKRGAFTLIELLVVIAIIALLMAALLPALGGARAYARAVVCQSKLKEWGVTLALYTEESQGHLPTDLGGNSGLWLLRGVFLRGDDPNANPGALHHFATRNLACCPMATAPHSSFRAGGVTISATRFGNQKGGEFLGTGGWTFRAWEIITPAPYFRGSYGYNQWVFKGFSRKPAQSDALEISSIRGRADTPVLLDSCFPWAAWSSSIAFNPPPNPNASLLPCCINRHNAGVNGLFLDWSVRRLGLKELWTLQWFAEFDRAGRWTKAGGVKPEDWPKWMRRFKDY